MKNDQFASVYRQETSRNHPHTADFPVAGGLPEWNLMHSIQENPHTASLFQIALEGRT